MAKENIKNAALALFAQNGYEGARLADIAKSVNMKAASLYFHFESKEQLFVELFDDVKERRFTKLNLLHKKVNSVDSAKRQLYELYHFFSARNYKNNAEELFWKRCTLFPPAFLREKIHEDLVGYQHKFVDETLRPVIEGGIRTGELKSQDPEIGVVAFFGIIDALFNEIYYSQEARYQEKVKLLWAFYWDALKNQPS